MKKNYVIIPITLLTFCISSFAQNIGINNTTPRFPLSFGNNNGNKISLLDDGNPAQLHFGIGVGSNQLLQLYSPTAFDDIAFGYGNSISFTERMRIKGNGNVGIGTLSPVSRLHVNDSSVVFTAPAILSATPGNTPVSGPGNRMMWYADKASFRAGNIINDSWDKDKTGNVSFAAGSNTQASGITSTAFGNFAFAMGDISFAAGNSVFAKARMAASFGTYNDNTDNPNASIEAPDDRIFQIGNGASNLTRTNALTVLRIGNIGIGTTLPTARLHVADSNVLFTGPATLPITTTYYPPASGAGSRMMWYPAKAAFRVGLVEGGQSTFWDKDSIGRLSFASGYGTKAKGEASVAAGWFTTASGGNSVAMGNGSIASGGNCIAIGDGAIASAQGGISVAIGRQPRASGNYSIAIGNNAMATSGSSTAFGASTLASGGVSTAMGQNTVASGPVSTALGNFTVAKALSAISIGSYNDDSDTPTGGPTDRIFQLGNGDFTARSNAITVLRNGNMGIGTINPNGLLQLANTASNRKVVLYETVNNDNQYYGFGINAGKLRYQVDNVLSEHTFFAATGPGTSQYVFAVHGDGNIFAPGIFTSTSDARLKKNIIQLGASLDKIKELNGYTYNWISPTRDQRQQIGLLAQDVQKIFPQLVTEFKEDNDEPVLGVNYLGLIPVLVEAIKEQQKQIDEQKKQIDEQKKMIEALQRK